jgi:hypothetical protein
MNVPFGWFRPASDRFGLSFVEYRVKKTANKQCALGNIVVFYG